MTESTVVRCCAWADIAKGAGMVLRMPLPVLPVVAPGVSLGPRPADRVSGPVLDPVHG